jgi:hypothetical protein
MLDAAEVHVEGVTRLAKEHALVTISPDLALPAEDFIEGKFAIIGQSGRGKSGLLKVIEEELVRNQLPFVVFDPAGVAWGIRSSLDGKGPGLPVLVVGGQHADLPLNRSAGGAVARAIVRANVSVIIDFSEEPKAAYRQFVTDFCETIYAINDTSRLIIIDEAKELVPQVIRPDQTRAYDAVERLVRQGRNKGLGVILVSQRAATVNKDVLTQCGSLIVFGLVGAPDRKQLREWVEAWATPEQLTTFLTGLAQLKQRECWFWSPQEFSRFQQVRVAAFHTLHPDRTHLRKMGLLKHVAVTTDIPAIVSRLGTELEQVKADKVEIAEVRRLRAQVAKLEREKGGALIAVDQRAKISVEEVERQVARRAEEATAPLRAQLRASQSAHTALVRKVASAQKSLGRAVQDLDAAASESLAPYVSPQVAPVHTSEPVRTVSYPPLPTRSIVQLGRKKQDAEDRDPEAPNPKGGQLRMLRYLAAIHPKSATRTDLGAASLIAPNSGTFSDYLSALRRWGVAEDRQDGSVSATQDGVHFFDTKPDPPSSEELVSGALAELSGGARRMLHELVTVYPGSLSRAELGEKASIASGSGTFSDYLSLLRRRGYAVVEGQQVTAAGVLFP